ncbi:hypothetical protein GCM10023259_005420 [Thermocatellispora tengchongensis]
MPVPPPGRGPEPVLRVWARVPPGNLPAGSDALSPASGDERRDVDQPLTFRSPAAAAGPQRAAVPVAPAAGARGVDPEHLRRRRCGLAAVGAGRYAEAAGHCGQAASARRIVTRSEEAARLTPPPSLHARAVLSDVAQAEARYQAAPAADLSWRPLARARLAYVRRLRRRHRVAGNLPQAGDHVPIGAGKSAQAVLPAYRACPKAAIACSILPQNQPFMT